MAAIDKYNDQIKTIQGEIAAQNTVIDNIMNGVPTMAAIKKSLDDYMASLTRGGLGTLPTPIFQDPKTGEVSMSGAAVTNYNHWNALYNKNVSDKATAQDLIDNPVTGYKKQIKDLQDQAANDPAVKNDQAIAIGTATQSAAYVQENTKYLIIGGIVLVIIIIGAVIYFKSRKAKSLKLAA
jgi:hypothetical protein